MKLTIKNVAKVIASKHNEVNVIGVNTKADDTYDFKFYTSEFDGEFTYTIHRTLKQDERWVGTLKHPHGSYRLDCYEMDLLDKNSFLYFLNNAAYDWYVQYKK